MRIYPVIQAWHLGEHERKDFTIDVSNEIREGESITTVAWTSDPDDLTLDNQSELGTAISVWASGPKPGTAYHVNAHVTTGLAKEFDVPILIAGVDKSR